MLVAQAKVVIIGRAERRNLLKRRVMDLMAGFIFGYRRLLLRVAILIGYFRADVTELLLLVRAHGFLVRIAPLSIAIFSFIAWRGAALAARNVPLALRTFDWWRPLRYNAFFLQPLVELELAAFGDHALGVRRLPGVVPSSPLLPCPVACLERFLNIIFGGRRTLVEYVRNAIVIALGLLDGLHLRALLVNERLLAFGASDACPQLISISLYALGFCDLGVAAELILRKRKVIVGITRGHVIVPGQFAHLAVCASYHLDADDIRLLPTRVLLLLTIVLLIIYHIYYYF